MPQSNRQSSRKQSFRIAFCGMLVALSVVLMLTGGLIPIMTYVSPLVSGVLLLPILLEFGRKYAWTAFAATALIVLFLGVDKEAAFFYLFLGNYPVLKWEIDKIKVKPLRLLTKLLLFTASMGLMYAILGFLLHLDAVVADFREMGIWMTAAFFVMMDICMLLYDWLMLPLVLLYANRIKPKLKGITKS